MKKIRMLFQGDSITDALRDRRNYHDMGKGYPKYASEFIKGFREMKIYEGLTDRSFGIGMKLGERYYASVHDVLFKDIAVYADEGIVREYGDGCVRIELENLVEGSAYYNIVIDGLTLNGKQVDKDKLGAFSKEIRMK